MGAAHRIGELFGFAYVDTPGFEPMELFARTSGESSDVVRKEMYTFEDRGGRMLTLRPEGTAPIVRAYLANRNDLPTPFKAYFVGPMWRYGRPQTGRSREFRQFDVEIIGVAEPSADIEVMVCGERYLAELGLEGYHLEVNSIGDQACRPQYREMLLEYLKAQVPRLKDEHKERFRDNPLRVLDCKDPACREVSEDAPKITDHLCDPCRKHFDGVLAGLGEEGVKYQLVPTLVRGLDYYTRTAFEWVGDALPPNQASLGGGGRYDGLAELIGGPPTPGVGFALGLEPRILLALESEGRLPAWRGIECFVVTVGADASGRGRDLLRTLRAAGVSADRSFGERPLKAQLRMADRAGARYALILGDKEAESGTVTVRRMEDGHQETVPSTDVSTWISQQA
jgi:histidyl-tRNA synthetase